MEVLIKKKLRSNWAMTAITSIALKAKDDGDLMLKINALKRVNEKRLKNIDYKIITNDKLVIAENDNVKMIIYFY